MLTTTQYRTMTTEINLTTRILKARKAGKLSDGVALVIIQDLLAGGTELALTTLKTLRGGK